jgi:hypothetical protein
MLRHAPRLTARARALLTAMNLHFAGVAALAVIVLALAIHLFFTWTSLQANDAEALSAQHSRLLAAEIAAKPLRGIDAKVTKSTDDADQFYADRLPYATSQVAAELGKLTHAQGIRLARVQYAYGGVLQGDDQLTEVRMDAGVSGDYRPVMQFINTLERDEMFFVINGINLTGQQTGQVNLRIRLTTFLREPDADELAHGAALTPAEDPSASAGGAQ